MAKSVVLTALASVVAIAAGGATAGETIYSHLTPDPDGFGGVNVVQSLVDSPIADDLQVVGGGVLETVTFAAFNQGGFFGGSPAASDATLTIALGAINPADGLPDFDGSPPLLVHTFTTDVLDLNIPTLQTVDVSALGVVIPDDAILMVSIYYDNFNFRHVKAQQGAATVGSSTDAIRPYNAGDLSRSGDLMYELTASDPCTAADRNDTGIVTILDLLIYLHEFFSGDPSADIDGSGAVDVLDLLAYLDLWFDCRIGRPRPPGGGG